MQVEAIVHLQIVVGNVSVYIHKDRRGGLADSYSGKRGAGHREYV